MICNYHCNNMYTYVGETYASLKFLYRILAQSLGRIIPHACQAIISELMDEYLKVY